MTVAHPHRNEQVERANGMILQGLKPLILTHKGRDLFTWLNTRAENWATEVPSVLWSLRTTPNCSTNFTPFFMVYGSEAVLLLVVIKCIYLLPTYLHFFQDIEDWC
jgi:hypothetical protein